MDKSLTVVRTDKTKAQIVAAIVRWQVLLKRAPFVETLFAHARQFYFQQVLLEQCRYGGFELSFEEAATGQVKACIPRVSLISYLCLHTICDRNEWRIMVRS